MANPCGFEYTDPKTGEKRYFKTVEEYTEAILSGYIDLDGAPELKSKLDKILQRNKGVMEAVYSAAEKAKNKREDFAKSLIDLNKIITESFVEGGEYTKSEVKKITRAALSIGLKPNVDIAVANFIEILDSVNSSKEEKRIESENESSRLKAIKSILSAKTTSTPYYVESLLEFLRVPFPDVPKKLRGEYLEVINSINKKDSNIDLIVDRARVVSQQIRSELINDRLKNQFEIDALMERVSDFAVNKGIASNNLKEIAKSMLEEGFLDKQEFDVLNSIENKQASDMLNLKQNLSEEERSGYKSSIGNSISNLKSSRNIIQDSFDRATREFVDFILDNMNDGFLDSLSDAELQRVFNTIDSLELGFNSSNLRNVKYKLDAFNRTNNIFSEINNSTKDFFFRPIARLKTGVKNIFGQKTNLRETLFRNHLTFAIDTVLGIQNKNMPVYSSLFGESASLYGGFETEYSNIQSNFTNPARQVIKDANKNDVRGIVNSNIKIGIYLIDLMHKRGLPNSPKIEEYFKDIIEGKTKEDSAYSTQEKELIRKNIEEYRRNEESFLTPEELRAVELIRGSLKSVENQSVAVSYYNNGKPLIPNDAYFPVEFRSKSKNRQQEAEAIFETNVNEFTNPGFSASHLKSKAGVTSPEGMVLNVLDPVSVADSYVKQILLKSKMQTEVTTALRTFDLLEKKLLSEQGENSDFYVSIFKLAKASYLDRVKNIVSEGNLNNTVADKAYKQINGIISTALLTGVRKFAGDIAGNIVNSSESPIDFTVGADVFLKNRGRHNEIIANLNVPEGKRLLIKSTGEGFASDVEASGLGRRGKTVRLSGNETLANINQKILEPISEFANSVNENQIKKPDQLTAIPLFYGALTRSFKKITGVEIDFDRIAENDVQYMDKYRDALRKAVIEADIEKTKTVGSKNPFVLPPKVVLEGGGRLSVANVAKEWLNFFNQYQSAMGTAVLTAKGRDKITTSAVRIASSITYNKVSLAVSGAMVAGLNALLKGQAIEPNEEEKVKKEIRDIVDSSLGLINANSNNLTKAASLLLVEYANEALGEGLTREGEMTEEKKISRQSVYRVGKDEVDVAGILKKSTGSVGVGLGIIDKASDIVNEKEPVPTALGAGYVGISVAKIPLGKDIKTLIDSYKYDFIYNKAEIEKMKGKTTEEERRVYNEKLKDYLANKFKSMFFLDYSPEKSVYDSKNEALEARKKHQSDVEKVLDPRITDKVSGRSQLEENKNLYYKLFLQEKIANTKEMPLYERVRLIRSIDEIFNQNDRVIVGDNATMNMVKSKIEEAKKKGFAKNKKEEIESEKKKIDEILNGYSEGRYSEDDLFFLMDGFRTNEMKYDESEEYLREKLQKNEFKDLKYE